MSGTQRAQEHSKGLGRKSGYLYPAWEPKVLPTLFLNRVTSSEGRRQIWNLSQTSRRQLSLTEIIHDSQDQPNIIGTSQGMTHQPDVPPSPWPFASLSLPDQMQLNKCHPTTSPGGTHWYLEADKHTGSLKGKGHQCCTGLVTAITFVICPR